jgi:imidazolonepropionase-like amidohydrolase
LEIIGATVFEPDGRFEQRTVVIDDSGRFAEGGDGRLVLDGARLWAIPGVYDCHSHITWNDFHHDQRERKSRAQRDSETADALAATLRGGVLNLRDAGGAPKSLQDAVASGALAGPRLQVSVEMIGATHAGTADTMRGHVEAVIGLGAQWIKLVATAGSSTPGDAVLRSNFSEAEIKAATATAAEGGARVMVHTWGGDSADWAIEHGAASIEHGIYLTPAQVSAAVAAGMTFVPTITIYRHVRDMVLAGKLDGVAFDRIMAVIAAHEDVVRLADREGLPLAIGSDFTTPEQHGTNLIEISALMRAGIAPVTALLAATAHGATLFGDPDGGRIAVGARADLVLLSADPTDPATFDDPAHVVGVLKEGKIAYLDPAVPRPTAHARSDS